MFYIESCNNLFFRPKLSALNCVKFCNVLLQNVKLDIDGLWIWYETRLKLLTVAMPLLEKLERVERDLWESCERLERY